MLDKLFENKEKINVVYFGGSITQGAAASTHNNSYAGLTAAWLKEKFSLRFGKRLLYVLLFATI